MTKQDIPENKEANPFMKDGKLDQDVVAKFAELLKSDEAVKAEVTKTLGITQPTSKPDSKPETDTAQVQKLQEIYSFALNGLKEAGIDPTATPIQSKMSEYEEAMSKKIESIATAKFSEQLDSIKKVDADFPFEAIQKLDIPTESKIAVANALQSVVSRNAEGIAKLQKELDGLTGELTEVKARAPAKEEPDTRPGSEIVKEFAGKFGLDTKDIPGLQDESKPDTANILAQAIKDLAKGDQ